MLKSIFLGLLLSVPAFAQGVKQLDFGNLSIGDRGLADSPKSKGTPFEVKEILDKQTAIIIDINRDDRPVILSGMDTSKWADGKSIDLKMLLEVTGTRKIGSKTYFVISPVK